MSHFTDHQLKLLTAAEGKILKKVVVYFWVNRFNPDAHVDLIDNVELVFTDDTTPSNYLRLKKLLLSMTLTTLILRQKKPT
jgi:hypothetical protein